MLDFMFWPSPSESSVGILKRAIAMISVKGMNNRSA